MKSVKKNISDKIKNIEEDIDTYTFNIFNIPLYNNIRNKFPRLSLMYIMRIVLWKTLTKIKK